MDEQQTKGRQAGAYDTRAELEHGPKSDVIINPGNIRGLVEGHKGVDAQDADHSHTSMGVRQRNSAF